MVGQINHLANLLNEGVTEAYFFLKKSYMANATHTMPMPAKNKPTKLAHNASMYMLSIAGGQLQCCALVQVIGETGNAVFARWQFSGILEICTVVQDIGHKNLAHHIMDCLLAKL